MKSFRPLSLIVILLVILQVICQRSPVFDRPSNWTGDDLPSMVTVTPEN